MNHLWFIALRIEKDTQTNGTKQSYDISDSFNRISEMILIVFINFFDLRKHRTKNPFVQEWTVKS